MKCYGDGSQKLYRVNDTNFDVVECIALVHWDGSHAYPDLSHVISTLFRVMSVCPTCRDTHRALRHLMHGGIKKAWHSRHI